MKGALIKLVIILLASVLTGCAVYFAIVKGKDRFSESMPLDSQKRVSAERDLRDLIQNIKAPSGGLGAHLLSDGVEADVNAWHAPVNPQYPVAIDVTFHQPVQVQQIGFQAQLGPLSNFARAPKEVKVYGGETFEDLKGLGALTLEFETVGAWTRRDLPGNKNKYPCYRIEILSNHGSPDYLTLQELNFVGKD